MEKNRWDFEYWMRFALPKQLYLSESKQAAMKSIFYHFSDVVKPLQEKAPKEFKTFFAELQKLIKRASFKRCPKGCYLWENRYVDRPKKAKQSGS